MPLVAIFLALIFFHSLASRRLERTVLTAPILFTTAGMLVALVLASCSRSRATSKCSCGSPSSGLRCCSSPRPAAPASEAGRAFAACRRAC